MQRREASIILGTIVPQLRKDGIWNLTIHDSVVVLEEDADHVRNLMLGAFREAIGIEPTVNKEVLVDGKVTTSTDTQAIMSVADALMEEETVEAAQAEVTPITTEESNPVQPLYATITPKAGKRTGKGKKAAQVTPMMHVTTLYEEDEAGNLTPAQYTSKLVFDEDGFPKYKFRRA
jgi:hypothetical protein